MDEARSLNTIEAPRQKLMKESATVVATTTLGIDDGNEPSFEDIRTSYRTTVESGNMHRRFPPLVSGAGSPDRIINSFISTQGESNWHNSDFWGWESWAIRWRGTWSRAEIRSRSGRITPAKPRSSPGTARQPPAPRPNRSPKTPILSSIASAITRWRGK